MIGMLGESTLAFFDSVEISSFDLMKNIGQIENYLIESVEH